MRNLTRGLCCCKQQNSRKRRRRLHLRCRTLGAASCEHCTLQERTNSRCIFMKAYAVLAPFSAFLTCSRHQQPRIYSLVPFKTFNIRFKKQCTNSVLLLIITVKHIILMHVQKTYFLFKIFLRHPNQFKLATIWTSVVSIGNCLLVCNFHNALLQNSTSLTNSCTVDQYKSTS